MWLHALKTPEEITVRFSFALFFLVFVVADVSLAFEVEAPTPLEGLSLLQLRASRVGGSTNVLSAEAVKAAMRSLIEDTDSGTTFAAVDDAGTEGLAELLCSIAARADADLVAEVRDGLAKAEARLVRKASAAGDAVLAIDAIRLSVRYPDETGVADGGEGGGLAAFNVTEVDRQLEAVRKLRRAAEEDEAANDGSIGAVNNSLTGDHLAFAATSNGLIEEQAGAEAMAEFKSQASELVGQLRTAAASSKQVSLALEDMVNNYSSAEGAAEVQRWTLRLDDLSELLASQREASNAAGTGVADLRCSFASLLTPQTLQDQADCSEAAALKPRRAKKTVLKFVHIISLMPGMDAEQMAVLDSMAEAKKHAERHGGVEVTLLAVQMVGEKKQRLPSEFRLAPPLSNNTNAAFGCHRSLPFARDLLLTLEALAPDADFYVMTNSDICVTPHFYLDLASANRQDGFTGLNVLKVIIPAQCDGTPLSENRSKALHYAETLPQTHPGSDCFMWEARRTHDVIERIGDVFFGWPPLGSALHNAIRAVSSKFRVVRGEHWTYHIGGEGERGRGSSLHIPSVVTKYQAEVEKAYPGCSFVAEHEHEAETEKAEGAGDSKEEDDCNYVSLNTRWSDLYTRCIESDAGCMDADEREAS